MTSPGADPPETPAEPAHLALAAGFPAADLERWQELVLGVLRKSGRATADTTPAEAEALLTLPTYDDGVALRPLYTAADVTDLPPSGVPGLAPYVRGGRPQGANGTGWDVRAHHAHPDPNVAAEAVIADLEHGVTSLWLTLGGAGLPVDALPDVLREVFVDLAPIALDAGAETAAAARTFLGIVDDRGIPAGAVAGSLGADPLGLAARTGDGPDLGVAVTLATAAVRETPLLRAITVDALVHHDAGASDADELGTSIAAGVAYLRALTGAGLPVDAAFGQLEFRYAATAEQFPTIAKLRAARRLWDRVGELSGAAPAARAQRQHAVTSTAMMTRRDPWVNMLRTTLACFGAGVGGADAVTVQPFDTALGLPDDLARRVARNTQTLLQEESSLIRVVDPAGGSWFVERLTDDLARSAWAWFTEIERAGGLAAALASGLVADRFAATRATRDDDIAHRRRPLTGVSEFPNIAETVPARVPAPAMAGGGLPAVRYAEPFERLRDRSDAHPTRPAVFLATLGSAAASTARAGFAGNLFQAGGLATPTSGAGTDPAAIAAAFRAGGTTVACLCSADKVYAEHAAPVAAALRAAGATRIWLAGTPGDRDDPDVDGYVAPGCDAIAVLGTTLDELGVA